MFSCELCLRQISILSDAFIFGFLSILGFELVLAREVLYHLSPILTLFALVLFQIGCCTFAYANFRPPSSYLYFPHTWDYRHASITMHHLFVKKSSW
jgi:hypothetical protein